MADIKSGIKLIRAIRYTMREAKIALLGARMKLPRHFGTGYILSITAAFTMMCVVPLLVPLLMGAQNQAGSTPACLKVSRLFRMILVRG
jgi:hypothetical protein